MANQLVQSTSALIRTSRDSRMFGAGAVLDPRVQFGKNMGLLVLTSDAHITREALRARRVVMSEAVRGAHTLFHFGDDTWQDHYAALPGIRWRGYAALQADDKAQSMYLFSRGLSAEEPDEAFDLMVQACTVYGGHRAAWTRVAMLLDEAGKTAQAARVRAQVAGRWTPGVRAKIEFENGVSLLGVSLPEGPVRAGSLLRVKSFWKADMDFKKEGYVVFVHLVQGEQQIAVDHVLLGGEDTANQPFAEVFVQELKIPIPATVSGDYELRMGVYPLGRGDRRDRVKGSSTLADDHGAFTIPAGLSFQKD